MGKIVKYCSSCDEGFAERFQFCPNCGAGMEAFEMNPVLDEDEDTSGETYTEDRPPVISQAEYEGAVATLNSHFDSVEDGERPVSGAEMEGNPYFLVAQFIISGFKLVGGIAGLAAIILLFAKGFA